MFKFTKAGINLISLGITTIIFILIQIFMFQYANGIDMKVDISQEIMQKNGIDFTVQNSEMKEDIKKWEIEIPAIQLKAEIAEGTDKETLNQKVGHFEETQKEMGNIGLAGHNRGYNVNYFENLKKLKEGDEIKYRHNDYENTYEVIKNDIIEDTDWSRLENTEENMITLITCVENEPNYRRCIQAIEKEEEID